MTPLTLSTLVKSAFVVFTSTVPHSRQEWDLQGCGRTHDSGYHDADASRSIQSGGRDRQYGVFVPESYNSSNQYKLILDYHGNHGTPENQHKNSRYFDYPEGEQYLVVYPAGIRHSWQSAPYATKGVNDLQFTTDLLAHLRTRYCIDSSHVYASGKSNGGGFVDLLACSSHGDEFAAFAMSSAALYSDNAVQSCGGARPRAILEAHGQNDTTISYYGGSRGNSTLPKIREWIGWWAERDGCDAEKDRTNDDSLDGYATTSYSCKGLAEVVQHYDVFDLGHCWPSSTGQNTDSSRSYCGDRSLDFTPVVLDFFGKWNLNGTSKK